MPKYYCEYCDIYLTHSSPVGRRQHNQGRKHISAKIEYFQNLLREEGITPQNFLGFLGNQAYNNILSNPMMNNFMHGNYNGYMKYNPMRNYHHSNRNPNYQHSVGMHNNKYSRAGYVPPGANKYPNNNFHNNKRISNTPKPYNNYTNKPITNSPYKNDKQDYRNNNENSNNFSNYQMNKDNSNFVNKNSEQPN
ncbi:RNA-binding protein, putative [Plasmodium chabaudi adami]|uniref:U1 small nuclear ribonucleoprotein C n=1 Tax=Plasmodium chabaudi adami TaxID=5826 RepID=A0A1C6YNR2_PLACE|nr:RNA-binding protein, putative [Plasmodium chabaudi adami]SCN62923.1 RNA-binding protein, putative [Plasmodium chabaudi adami]